MKTKSNANQGIYPVLAAIAIQLTLGVAYLWAIFQNGVTASIFNGDEAAAGLTFSLLLATLTIGSVFGGKLAVKYSTRFVVLIGGFILSAGFFLASFVTSDFSWLLWVTYGVMGGVGMGFTYSTTIACAQKWYPHKKGLVTGIIVASLGFGGVIFTPIIESLLTRFGGPGEGESNTFMVLSFVFLAVCTVASLFLKNPHDGHMSGAGAAKAANAKVVKDYTPLEMFKNPKFYLVMATFMFACMGGQMMIGFAKPIALAMNLKWVAIAVPAIAMFNSIGRLSWGMISDKLGRKNTILILLTGNAVLSLCVNLFSSELIYVVIALFGFFYGGLLSTFPSLTADLFGAKHMATNYGFVLLGFGGGAVVALQIAGHFRNVAKASGNIGDMFPAFVIASCCAAAGIVMMLVLKAMAKREKAKIEGGTASCKS